MPTITFRKGGTGSGHHGHRGRPGKRGGSVPGSGSGVGDGSASKQENVMLDRIGEAFIWKPVKKSDLKHIRYSGGKKSITMEDVDYRLGNMHTNIDAAEAKRHGFTIPELRSFIKANGGKPFPRPHQQCVLLPPLLFCLPCPMPSIALVQHAPMTAV